MKFAPTLEQILLLLACLLAVFAGGQPLGDAMPGASVLGALTGSAESTHLTRALLGLFILGGCGSLLLRQRAVVLPKLSIQVVGALFLGCSLMGVMAASFRLPGVDAWLNWLLMFGAMFLAVGCVGRRNGPLIVAALIAIAASGVGVRGILEYAAMRPTEPTYRIFAGWSNPNALASLFVIALPLSMGCIATLSGRSKLIAALLSLPIGIGLFLAQSKGGFLAAGIGVIAWLAVTLLWKVKVKEALIGFAPIAAAVIFAAAMILAPTSSPDGKTAGNRLLSASTEVEQSAGFRTQLWRSAIDLTAAQPLGWGLGSFRFESARPGRVSQTVLAHQQYLQLAMEAGVLGLLLFLGLAAFWIKPIFEGARSLIEAQNSLRAGVFGAIMAAGAHGFIETNLSYIGVGILFFVLLGVGLQLSSDGSAPELMPAPVRYAAAGLAVFIPLALILMFARWESAKSALISAVQSQDRSAITASLNPVNELAGFDGEAAYLAALYGSSDAASRARSLEAAAALHPTTRILRAAARDHAATGNIARASFAISRALKRDPNNLPTLHLHWRMLDDNGQSNEAEAAARALIKAESSSAYQTRALPEIQPTETLEARAWLARRTAAPSEKVSLLKPAVEGWSKYAKVTIGWVKRFAVAEMSGQAGVDSPDEASKNLALAMKDCDDLQTAAMKASDQGAAELAKSVRADAAAALASLRDSN